MRRIVRTIAAGTASLTLFVGIVLTASPAHASFTIDEFTTPTAGSAPVGVALGPDGNLWFTESGPDKIGRITPGGVITEFPTGLTATTLEGITAGPDGAMWFTAPGANVIGRITTSGAVTTFPLPNPNRGALNIAVGPDGRLWFTEFVVGEIGAMTTAGVLTEYPTVSPNSGPVGIAAGPDGRMWFTEQDASKVGRITTAGKVKEFPTTTDPAAPEGIAAGPDGNLWFAEDLPGNLGRISTAGTMDEFATTTSNSQPEDVAAGPDGAMWFTEFNANQIGQMSIAGSMLSESAIPTSHSGAYGIAPGTDGNLWFAESFEPTIGRLLLPHFNILNVYYIPNFFVLKVAPITQQGETVTWLMENPGTHGIADSSGMALFGFGATGGPIVTPIAQTYSFTFRWAGTYPYDDPFHTKVKGQVAVPISVQPAVGTTNEANVTWASGDAPAGFVFDAQVRVPGSSDFVAWRTGATNLNQIFGPSDPLWVGAGKYSFRARLRNVSSGAASGYSKAGSIKLM